MTVDEALQTTFAGNFHSDSGKFKTLETLARELYEAGNKADALRVMNHWLTAGMGCAPGELADLEEWYGSITGKKPY